MKQIIAFIKPHMLANVTTGLKNLPGLTGIGISEVGKSQSNGGYTR